MRRRTTSVREPASLPVLYRRAIRSSSETASLVLDWSKIQGFSGALALLMLVPVGNLVLLLYLAFAAWLALRDRPQPSVAR